MDNSQNGTSLAEVGINSWEAMRLALQARCPNGAAPADGVKLLLVALASEVRPQNGPDVWPGITRLAALMDVTKRTVTRRKSAAKQAGLIDVIPRQRHEGRGRTSDLIHLNFLAHQPDVAVTLITTTNPTERDEQPDRSDDQPDSFGTTNLTPASPDPEENQKYFEPLALPVRSFNVSVHHKQLESEPPTPTELGQVVIENNGNDNKRMGETATVAPTLLPSPDGPATSEQLEALRRQAERLGIPDLAEVRPTVNEADWLLMDAGGSEPGGLTARHIRKQLAEAKVRERVAA